MLTGRQAFTGDTVSEILASVLAREPDYTTLRSDLHPRIKEVLRRCFEKDPKKRWQDAGDLRVEIEQVLGDADGSIIQPAALEQKVGLRAATPWALATLVIGAVVAGSAVWVLRAPAPAETGESELYAYPFPISSAGRQTITTDTGLGPVWPRRFDELVFVNPTTGFMQAIEIQTEPTLTRSNPVDLFSLASRGLRVAGGGTPLYDVSSDGDRLLFSIFESLADTADEGEEDDRQINIVLNWTEELLERVPVE